MAERLDFTALVGSSFSGKSTLLADLKAAAPVTAIAEYCDYAGGNCNFRRLPFGSTEDARGNIDNFINWERLRQRDALKIQSENSYPVIMDRTVYCFLLTQLWLKKTFPTQYNSFEYGLDQVAEAMATGKLYLPGKMILLEPADEATFLGRAKRGVSVTQFGQPTTWRFFSRSYLEILEKLYGQQAGLVLYSANGLASRRQLIEQVKDFLISSEPGRLITAEMFLGVFHELGGIGDDR